MSESNPIFRSIRKSTGIRLAVLFGSFFIFLLPTSILSGLIETLPGSSRTHLLLSSIFQCVLAFCIPAFLLAKFSSRNPADWLHLKKKPPLKAIIGVIIVYFISLPAMEWLIAWNSNLYLPEFLGSLEELFRKWETSSAESSKILLNTKGLWSVVFGVLVIGFLTGFSEELFFRGGLQGIFIRSSLGKSAAIWMTAIIFSMMHFQFFGFFPRMLMGVFFGYLLVWTHSIWVPVFAHVLNNSIVVITSAITGEISTGIFDQQNSSIYFGNSWSVLVSFILTALFFLKFKNIFSTTAHKTWRKNHLQSVTER